MFLISIKVSLLQLLLFQISETIVLDIIENYNLYKLVSTICSAFARAILPVSVIGSLFMC